MWAEKELEGGLKERKRGAEDRRKASCLENALTHMLLISRGGRGRWERWGGAMEEKVGDRSSETAQQLVCVRAWLLSLYCNGRRTSVWQRRQKERYRATEAGSDTAVFGR